MNRRTQWIHDGTPLLPARGRDAPRSEIASPRLPVHPILDLPNADPPPEEFLKVIERELRLRYYRRNTTRTYIRSLRAFLFWTGLRPREITDEDVRNYLYCLVQEGADASTVAVHLAAIRTAFDKLCGQGITLSMVYPRRAKRRPVVLTQTEVLTLLRAAPRLADKLLLGLMYASGLRVSEVVRLRWEDVDLERGTLRVVDAKGAKDRYVVFPHVMKAILEQLSELADGRGWVFPSPEGIRHLSPRTAQRSMQRALELAGLNKRVTCHSLRHAYATHLLEGGTDVRVIQRLLGHARLETTTLYTHVAQPKTATVQSPLDTIRPDFKGFDITLQLDDEYAFGRLTGPNGAVLDGLRVGELRPGWCWFEVPPIERWTGFFSRLPVAERQQVEGAAFFEWMRELATRRFRQMVDRGSLYATRQLLSRHNDREKED